MAARSGEVACKSGLESGPSVSNMPPVVPPSTSPTRAPRGKRAVATASVAASTAIASVREKSSLPTFARGATCAGSRPCTSATERERTSLGIDPLPKTLYEAIKVAESSELLAEALGEHVYDFFLRNKRKEWEDYRVQVSAYERDQMLPIM